MKESDHGFEGYLHPPALCVIEGVKGQVMYSRQPPFCRRCMEVGHVDAECESVVCHNCREKGHMAAECKEPRSCNYCVSANHLRRACPERRRTYADAAREGAGQQQYGPAEGAAPAGGEQASGGEKGPEAREEPAPGPAEAGGPSPGPEKAAQPEKEGEKEEKEKEEEKGPVPAGQGTENGLASDQAGPSGEAGQVPNTDPEMSSLDGMETADEGTPNEGSAESDSEEPMVTQASIRSRGEKRKGRPEKASSTGEGPSKAKAKARPEDRPSTRPMDWAEEVEIGTPEAAELHAEVKPQGKMPQIFGSR